MEFNKKSKAVHEFFYNQHTMQKLGLKGQERLIAISVVSPILESGHYSFVPNSIENLELSFPNFLLSNFPNTASPAIDITLIVKDELGFSKQYIAKTSYIVFRNSLKIKATELATQAISYEAELHTSLGAIELTIYPFLGNGGLVKVNDTKIEI